MSILYDARSCLVGSKLKKIVLYGNKLSFGHKIFEIVDFRSLVDFNSLYLRN